MPIEQIVALVGLPAVVSVVVTFLLDSKKNRDSIRFEKLFLEKEYRYRSMLIFMSVVLDEKNLEHINTANRPADSNVSEYYKREVALNREYYILFAPESVLNAVDIFINNPSYESFNFVATEMRKDLWKK